LNTAEHPVMEEGYASKDLNGNDIWICDECFRDFRERFGWKLGTDSNAR